MTDRHGSAMNPDGGDEMSGPRAEDEGRPESRFRRYLEFLSQVWKITNQSLPMGSIVDQVLWRICRSLGWREAHWVPLDSENHPLPRLRSYVDNGEPGDPQDPWDAEHLHETAARFVDDLGSEPLLRTVCSDGEGPWRLAGEDAAGRIGYLVPIAAGERLSALLFLREDSETTRSVERIEREILESLGRLLAQVQERRDLDRRVADEAEKERRALGQELHDVLGQELTGIAMVANSLESRLREAGDERAQAAADLCSYIRSAQKKTRSLSRGLVPVVVDPAGLANALEALCEQTTSLHDVDCRCELEGSTELDDSFTATHLYRVAMEAVHNAVRHADATRIRVLLERDESGLRLVVEDDGKGLPAGSEAGSGVGLQIMRYRASLIEAELTLESNPDRGTRVVCNLPDNPGE